MCLFWTRCRSLLYARQRQAATRKPGEDESGRADEFRNVGLQDPPPTVRAYFAQQLDGSAAPSEGRKRLSTKYTGQKPVMPL